MNMKIGVLGGGFTGLVGAYRLALKGYKVTVIEKASELGGLACSLDKSNWAIEKAYHHIFLSDEYLIKLLEELGLLNNLKFYKSSVAIFYEDHLYPFSTLLDFLRFRPMSLKAKLRSLWGMAFLRFRSDYRDFQDISAYSWIKRYMGSEALEVIWEPLLRGKFGNRFKDISMAWLWARLYTRVRSRRASYEELGYIEGGLGTLVEKLKRKLHELDVSILLLTDVNDISLGRNNITLDTNRGRLDFDKLFCTFSCKSFVNFFENKVENSEQAHYIKNLKKIDYIGALVILFTSKQSLSSYYWHNINDVNMPFLVFIQHTNLVPSYYYNNKHVYYLAKYASNDEISRFSDDDLKNSWFDSLKKIFNQFEKNMIEESWVFRFRDAQHIVDIGYKDKIPSYKTPFKNVFLFNYSQIYPEDRGVNFAIREANKFTDFV